jgi:diguanylate cyclase (GGDEF)-like protein
MAHALRLAVGPLVTLLTVVAILATDRYLFAVPNPGAITFVAVVFATYLGGLTSGFLSAAISLVYAAVYFSVPGEFLHFRPDNLARMVVLIFGTPAIVIMVGVLQRRAERSLQQERIARLEMENADRDLRRLHASLDKVEDGIVLLDAELRAQFINRAFRRMWRLPDDKADSKPAFVALMYHGRATRAYAVPDSELNAYVAERTAKVRAGDETPMDLRLLNGEVIRFKCKALPDGGRMLSYVYVTDLVHHSDRLETLRAALEEVNHGVLLLDRELRAEFMNRAARELGGLREPAAGERPLYAELVRQVAANGAYAVPAEEIEAYIAERIEWVRRADLAPSELRLADGRVIDVRCIELRDQARMLTYTDVTGLVCHAEELENLATVDGLTGLYNRRHFLALAESEWSRVKRYERPLSLLMLDIDRFKSVNDRFGHDAGDKVIMEVAGICAEMKRATDVVGRIGGEELALLLPETDLDGALLLAERLRSSIAERPVVVGRESLAVSVSIGVAEAAPSITGIHDLMKRADEALYAAKRGGRNRVAAMGHAADKRVA